jgi:hypothetical protein
MSTLDDLKKQWGEKNLSTTTTAYNETSLDKLIKTRMKKHNKNIMNYFWASFVLQVMVYALFSHVIARYWGNGQIVLTGIFGILLFVPFTIVMMKKFKRFAIAKANGSSVQSIRDYMERQRYLLQSFFTFKKRYEWVLIPLASAIGVWLIFELYFPGGVQSFLTGALITYVLTLVSCYMAIRSENRKSFVEPLNRMKDILEEYNEQ